jgi:hypothetical protein
MNITFDQLADLIEKLITVIAIIAIYKSVPADKVAELRQKAGDLAGKPARMLMTFSCRFTTIFRPFRARRKQPVAKLVMVRHKLKKNHAISTRHTKQKAASLRGGFGLFYLTSQCSF